MPNYGPQFSLVEQLIRILMMTVGSYFLGDGLAENAEFQALIGGVIAVAGFAFWAWRQRQVTA